MDQPPAASRADLQARIAALPPVKPGHVRVFRGQVRRHAKLLASGHRGRVSPREMAWKPYAHLMAMGLASVHAKSPEDGYAALDDVLFWLEAIKQHYGPGSPFIDVTHALDVALWFALNEAESFSTTARIGPGQTPGVDLFLARRSWVGFKPATQPGWLYVLDVPRVSPGSSYAHGAFVDLLADAPEVYRTSRRIAVQQACLVLADPRVDGGDLLGYAVVAPIAIDPGLRAEIEGLGGTGDVFPAPDVDPWYARFLEVPQAWDLDGDASLPAFLAPALDITLYSPSHPPVVDELKRIGRHFVVQPPPLLLDDLLRGGCDLPGIDAALPILLEAPVTIATPPLAGGHWNEAALWHGLGHSTPVFDRGGGAPAGTCELASLFLEFHPLEYADWDAFFERGEIEHMRGVWLRRDGDGFEVWLALQTAREGPKLGGGFLIAFDADQRRIVIRNRGETRARLRLGETGFGKFVFAALLLVHHLSPGAKIGPFAHMVADGTKHLAVRQGPVARLELAPLPCGRGRYHRVRNAVDGAVYLGGGRAEEQAEAIVELAGSFADATLATLEAAFAAHSP